MDSKICEFCGWDFEEEDEWILQIEKLERELMMEKRKFEPGSVEQRIEASLHTPTPSRPSAAKAEKVPEPVQERPAAVKPVPTGQARGQAPQIRAPKHRVVALPKQEAAPVTETIEIDDMRIRSVRGGSEPERPAEMPKAPVQTAEPESKVRRMRSVKAVVPTEASPEAAGEGKTRKVRVVRKVKK